MKRVRINKIKVGDIISYDSRFWLVESVSSHCVSCETFGGSTYVHYIVKIHDCEDIFYTRYLTNSHRFYTVM